MKAIETKYKGYRFRSRLEARWAVFFDALGIKWEYETDGYDLGEAGWYLPDFIVTTPDGDQVIYEIKPSNVLSDAKFEAFKLKVDARTKYINALQARLLSGDPMHYLFERPGPDSFICPRCGVVGRFDYGVHAQAYETSYGCMFCDSHTPCGGGNPDERGLLAVVTPHKGALILREPLPAFRKKVMSACEKARSARFEHGETP